MNGVGKPGRIKLDPETVEIIRQKLPPEEIRKLHAILKTKTKAAADAPLRGPFGQGVAKVLASDWYANNMVMRRNHAVRSGTINYDNNSTRYRIATALYATTRKVQELPLADIRAALRARNRTA